MESTRAQSQDFRTPERWNSIPVPDAVAKRAYERVEVNESGCWISAYSVASHGYAQIGWQVHVGFNHMVLAHRAAWVHVNGQMPLGMTLDHLCKTRRCVNPDHLRLLPNYENARRVAGKDWPLGYCANGHPNSERTHEGSAMKKGRATPPVSLRAVQAHVPGAPQLARPAPERTDAGSSAAGIREMKGGA